MQQRREIMRAIYDDYVVRLNEESLSKYIVMKV